jgi:hypothetical protein
VIGYTFLFIAVLTTFTYIFGWREFPQLGRYLEMISILASIVPSTVLAYFIYRYNFLELVIRRSFFVITLSVVIFGIYFLGIRQLTEYLSGYFQVVPGLFEAICPMLEDKTNHRYQLRVADERGSENQRRTEFNPIVCLHDLPSPEVYGLTM